MPKTSRPVRRTALTAGLAAAALALSLTGCATYDAQSPKSAREAAYKAADDGKAGAGSQGALPAGAVDCRKAKCIALTFDAGPSEHTPALLKILAEKKVRVTFFLLGHNHVDKYPDLVRQMGQNGNVLGNHTWTHGTPLGTRPGAETAEAEVTRTQDLLGPLAHPDKLFRPHGGGRIGPQLLSPEVAGLLRAGGYTCVLWTSVPGDYRDPDGWVEPALADCASRPWTVMVLHDLPNGAMAHLGRFLDAARDARARFRQDFPADCIPILRGEARAGLEGLVTPG